MKNTFKVEIHILYYLIGLFCFLMGYFKDFIWISLLIMIHECGHVTAAILWKWKIDKIWILPFGGLTLLQEKINAPYFQEWWIVLLGPIYQIIFFQLLSYLKYTNATFTIYHYLLLGFNLLPMIPLDGSKILSLLLESIFSYEKAKYINLLFSIFFLISCFLYSIQSKNIILGILLLFLIKENWKFYKQIPYQSKKFLLERYLYPFSFSKCIRIQGINLKKMKRGYTHLFWCNGLWKTEKEILKSYFEFH